MSNTFHTHELHADDLDENVLTGDNEVEKERQIQSDELDCFQAWRKKFKVVDLMKEDFADLEMSGKLQCWGQALDKSFILVWTGSRHVARQPSDASTDREIRYIIWKLERMRQQE
eukprot:jgi/Hompol1/1840/HPOL_004829-RA